MTDQFSDLTKLTRQPAARLLSMANAELETELVAPASASVEVVLRELSEKGALIDMMRLLSVALPARERVWWSCLAARDILVAGAKLPPPAQRKPPKPVRLRGRRPLTTRDIEAAIASGRD